MQAFVPLHDATMGDHEAMFALLAQYLQALDLSSVARIVFCGDGAPWIGSGVEKVCGTMGLAGYPIYQVLDYTHAKQNLQEIIDLVPRPVKQQAKLVQNWKDLLWQGNIQGLYQEICRVLSGQPKRKALKKGTITLSPMPSACSMQPAKPHIYHVAVAVWKVRSGG